MTDSGEIPVAGDNRGIVAGGDVRDVNHVTAGDVAGSYNAIGVGAQVVITRIQQALSAIDEQAKERRFAEEQLASAVQFKVEKLREAIRQPDPGEEHNPYRALLSYGLEHAPYFYGRDGAIQALLDKVHSHRLTVLHAGSGSGKSSLLQAGLMSRLLAGGHLPLWLRPHRRAPAAYIKKAFLPDVETLPELARFEQQTLLGFLRSVAAYLGDSTLYLFLDQFEEFFTLVPRAEQEAFAQELADCLDAVELDVRWVISLRKESFSDLSVFQPRVAPFANEYFLETFRLEEAKEVIVEPARLCGVEYDPPDLVDRILDELHEGDGRLQPPQVQLVCHKLFAEARASATPDRITRDLYERPRGSRHVPGALGILSSHLSSVLDEMPADRATARRILEALITSEGTRGRVAQAELVAAMGQQPAGATPVEEVLAQLVDRRLVRVDEDAGGVTFYELAHDYLLGEIEVDPVTKARKAAQELLDQEAEDYRKHGTLLSDRKFDIIQSHVKQLRFDDKSEEMFKKSKEEFERSRQAKHKAESRQRTWTAFAVVLLATTVVLLAASAFSIYQMVRAGTAANIAFVWKLLAQSELARAQKPLLGLRLALEAGTHFTQYETIDSNQFVDVVAGYTEKLLRGPQTAGDAQVAVDQKQRLLAEIDSSVEQFLRDGRTAWLGKDIFRLEEIKDGPLMIVKYRAPDGAELRRKDNGEKVADLAGPDASVDPIDAAFPYFVVSYLDSTPSELRRKDNGEKLDLPGRVASVDPIDAAFPYFVVSYSDSTLSELRRKDNGEKLDLAGRVASVDPIDAAFPYFMVSFSDSTLSELRRKDNGEKLDLPGGVVSAYSIDAASPFFVATYWNGTPSELRRKDNGEKVADLPGGVVSVYPIDAASPYFVVSYWEGTPSELRRKDNGEKVADLAGSGCLG